VGSAGCEKSGGADVVTLAATDIHKIAEDIWHAEQTGEWTEAPSNRFPDITVADGYAIGTAVSTA
jgi:2-keto-4-pentenoate hydratase